MNMYRIKLCIISLLIISTTIIAYQKPIVIIIPSYNNSKWYIRNLSSVLDQEYDNYRIIYIDDCSTDGMSESVVRFITKNDIDGRVTYIRNAQRRGALANLHDAIYDCADDEIVVTVDGDDWLEDSYACGIINSTYSASDVWITYGRYREYPSNLIGAWRAIPQDVIQGNAFRDHEWLSTHLRTFYAGLFKKIAPEDLLFQGKFFQKTWDMAFMFPMLEMAGTHVHHMSDVLYVYNIDNPLNDFKQDLDTVLYLENVIRRKKRYTPLDTLS